MGYLYGEDLVSALPALSRAVEAFEPLDDSFGLAWARFTRGVTNDSLGDPRAAITDYALAFEAFEEADDLSGVTLVLGRVLGDAAGPRSGGRCLPGGRRREPLGGRDRHPPRDHRPQPRVPDPGRRHGRPELRAAFDEGAAMPREAGQRLVGAMLRELAAEGSARA